MQSYLLRENVLTDNTLTLSSKNRVFKGNYIAIVKENSFLNAWQDKETIKKFRSKDKLLAYLNKNYKKELQEFDFSGTCLEQ